MSRVLDSTALIKTVRRRAMIPNDSSTFTDDDIIEILNEEIDVGLLSTILALNEEHLVVHEDQTVSSGTSEYKIPYRSIGNKLRDVALLDSSNNIYEMSRISLEELSDYRSYRSYQDSDIFYVKNNQVVLVDTTTRAFEKIRMYFYLRPNKLVKTSDVGVISNIDTDTGVVTVSNFPSDFSTLEAMDFVSKRSPSKILAYDIVPSSSSQVTKTITFTASDLPSDLSVGDYLCKAEETPVPNIPTELHPVLAQRCAVYVLESLGDTEGLKNAMARLQQMETATQQLIDDRVEGSPQKINPRHTTLVQSLSRNHHFRKRY